MIDLASRLQRQQEIGLGHHLVADERHAVGLRERRTLGAQRHFQAQLIARHHLPSELCVVHAAEIGERTDGRLFPFESSTAAAWLSA